MRIDVGRDSEAALLAARDRLTQLARGATDERRMAAVARTAIFQEALLGALRSRLSELRSVAK